MKRTLLLAIAAFATCGLSAQSTNQKVYDIFQAKCVTCHDGNAGNNGGLNLTGTLTDVYNRIYMQNPTNAVALAAQQKLIYPGRIDRSAIFRRINDTFEPTVALAPNEGAQVHAPNNAQLTIEEKELLRQWIQFGAPSSGNVYGESRIHDYYNGMGEPSFPNGAPAAPAPGEGFQIKMGPFFMEPNGEVEFYQKYELTLPANVEVNRINTMFSGSSHHFLMYSYNNVQAAAANPHGLRLDANHNQISLVEAIQEPTDLVLPERTAFYWPSNRVLDLNTHYINYGANIYGAEVYINVYTQVSGTALEEMKTLLIPNLNIYIPNDQQPHTFSQSMSYPLGTNYVWSLMGHTHKYGTDFNIYKRNANGSRGPIVYDAACFGGVPGCVSPNFDYQHIPMRYYQTVFPLNFNHGLIQEATYVNNGPAPVQFGATSDDEMMLFVMMYIADTTGLNIEVDQLVTGLDQPQENLLSGTQVSPNPATDVVRFEFPVTVHSGVMSIYDATGRLVRKEELTHGSEFFLQRNGLSNGLYFWRVEDKRGNVATGKLLFEF